MVSVVILVVVVVMVVAADVVSVALLLSFPTLLNYLYYICREGKEHVLFWPLPF